MVVQLYSTHYIVVDVKCLRMWMIQILVSETNIDFLINHVDIVW